MGRWTNKFNRKRAPYGALEYGAGIEETLLRASLDSHDELVRLRRDLDLDSRCQCCRGKFKEGALQGGHCKTCVPHAYCRSCGKTYSPTERSAWLFSQCIPCRDEDEACDISVHGLSSKEIARRSKARNAIMKSRAGNEFRFHCPNYVSNWRDTTRTYRPEPDES